MAGLGCVVMWNLINTLLENFVMCNKIDRFVGRGFRSPLDGGISFPAFLAA